MSFIFLMMNRAEVYFKQAMGSHSVDGEAIVQFANFLWLARGDISAAGKTYLDAINVEPWNPFHAAKYAHFLWHTGGAEASSYSDNPTISPAESTLLLKHKNAIQRFLYTFHIQMETASYTDDVTGNILTISHLVVTLTKVESPPCPYTKQISFHPLP
jgi:hypothetical protein